MNNENQGQTIPDMIAILERKEEDMRNRRNKNMIRLFAESSSNSIQRRFELKQSSKLNIKMIRQFRYDSSKDKVQLKSIPCICEECLKGNFYQCLIYDQPIIEVDIVESNGSIQLRNAVDDENHEIEDFDPPHILGKDYTIDLDFVNLEFQSDPERRCTTPRQDSQNINNPDSQNDNASDEIRDVELSSPNPTCVTSSQKDGLIELKDFGSLDEDVEQTDDQYILDRLACMSNSAFIEPIRFGTDKRCLQAILEKTGLVEGFSLDYIGYMLLKQYPNSADCSFLKTQLCLWLKYPVKTRADWTTNLISTTERLDEQSFIKSKRIILPWNKDGNHWTVFHFDSTKKIIESFDSFHSAPHSSDLKRITNFLRVSILFISTRFDFLADF